MPNKYVLKVYPQAARDMESIFEYIAITLCNPTAAAKQVRDFEKALNIVCSQPESCALIQNEYVKDRTLRKLIVNNYIVFYRADKNREEIQVVRALYGMMDYEKLL